MDIRELIDKAGGQTELALRYGIPLRTVQNWAAGTRKPPAYVVELIEQAMKQKERAEDFANFIKYQDDQINALNQEIKEWKAAASIDHRNINDLIYKIDELNRRLEKKEKPQEEKPQGSEYDGYNRVSFNPADWGDY